MAKRNTYGLDESLETPFNIKNFLRCKPYILRNIKPLLLALTFSIITTVFALLGPTFTQIIIDKHIPAKNIRGIIIVTILYFSCLALSELFSIFQTIATRKAGHQIIHEIRADIFSHIQKLSFN